MKNNYLVIMAGGVGSRFWPMSTQKKPKQFLDILGTGRTLLQLTADRFSELVPKKNIWIVTSESYKEIVEQQLPDIDKEQILLEPCMRNTAPCIAYASWKIKQKYSDANIVVSPADHIVLNQVEFTKVIRNCFNYIDENEDIITLGMQPSRPEIGYGYIQANIDDPSTIKAVSAFKEKPNLETAKEYLEDGSYYWNGGIFFWSVKTVESAFRQYLPSLARQFDSIENSFYTDNEQAVIKEQFPKCENISLDYGIMEKAKNIKVQACNFGWSDLGTWSSLHEQLEKDPMKNAIVGKNIKMIDSHDCVVHVPIGRRYIVQGLHDYIIAENGNTVLICKKSDEQRIKEFSK
ncbi:MAG: mannose-1-phosphate guanylyltransferase [Marinifilaceae bacterium]